MVGASGEASNQTTITNGTTSSANNTASDSGAAYVYKRSGSTWSQEAYLKASNAEAGDGHRLVSISGDTIVVGAPYEASNQTTITNGTTSSADNNASGSGAAYVYRRTQATGTPSLSSISPSSGAAAGNNIIIFGANFYSGAVASVDGVNCTTTTVQGPNEIICTLPTKPSTGALTVTVTNSDATSGSLANAYTYEPTVCAIYTVRAENIIAACSELISQNSEGLREVAPNCESSFLAITPRVGCPLLVSQLNNAIGATGCGIVFTIHRSYLTPACAEAYDQLVSNSPSNSPSNPPVVAPNNLVTYTIVNGQGSAPWGSLSNPIRGVVGQVLRIVNNDGQPHQIHTAGNPFNHTVSIPSGAMMDFPLLRPITTGATSPSTYEHNFGPTSPIYFAVTAAP